MVSDLIGRFISLAASHTMAAVEGKGVKRFVPFLPKQQPKSKVPKEGELALLRPMFAKPNAKVSKLIGNAKLVAGIDIETHDWTARVDNCRMKCKRLKKQDNAAVAATQ